MSKLGISQKPRHLGNFKILTIRPASDPNRNFGNLRHLGNFQILKFLKEFNKIWRFSQISWILGNYPNSFENLKVVYFSMLGKFSNV